MTEGNGITQRIRDARERAQLEPAQLRKAMREHGVDLSKAGLHRLETQDPKNPSLKLISTISEITKVSPSWLLFGEGTSTPPDKVGLAIRGRVIDTIELMIGALDLTSRQEATIERWLASVKATKPKKVSKP